ncbi:MAG: glycogen debranching protein GlgX [Actinobacteria bacterium]|nr:glycogen debranching protein GlgX [Actinomycetota bacterium]
MIHPRPGDWDPLGVHLIEGGANVAVWAQGADAVELCVFSGGTEQRIALPDQTYGVFSGHIPDLSAGTEYGFRVHGPWDPLRGARWNPAKLLADPYARAISGRLTLHEAIFGHADGNDLEISNLDSAPYVPRSVVVDGHFDWEGDQPLGTAWSDTIIYETHVKGATARHHDIPEHLRGTYAGLSHPAFVNHLTHLGVSAVELMPVHHFVDEVHLMHDGLTNYWGYNTLGYFAPHAAYSSRGERGGQVTEFKQMVKDLHRAGLEVILDVVYNHTCEAGQTGPTLAFRGLNNTGYYRTLNGGRDYDDVTGCGNTLNAGAPHILHMITDSLRYWVEEMHVDGFRFDLASALTRDNAGVDLQGRFIAAIQADPVLRRVKLIAEPWDLGPGGYQVGGFPAPWTEWNGRYRDNLRDYWRGATAIGELGWRLTGSADIFDQEGRRPFASVNFVTAHDGFTLRDLVTYSHKHNEANLEGNRDGTDDNRSENYGVEGETADPQINDLRRRQIRNMLTTLILSTGVPMLLGGDEFGRTQRGSNNAYCQDNQTSWYNWTYADWQCDLYDFTRDLLHIRREHAAFRQHRFFEGEPIAGSVTKDLTWFGGDGRELSADAWNSADSRTLGMFLYGRTRDINPDGSEVRDDSFLLILHSGAEDTHFVLPRDPYATSYTSVLDTREAHHAPQLITAGTAIPVMGRSAVLLRAHHTA